MFMATPRTFVLRPIHSHKTLDGKARIIQNVVRQYLRNKVVKDVLALFKSRGMNYVTPERNLELWRSLHHADERELVDGLRQHVRLAHYAPEERLEAVRLALDQVKDQLDEDEVNAYHHAKLVQQTHYRPKIQNGALRNAVLTIQRRWRLAKYAAFFSSTAQALGDQHALYQRSQTADPMAVLPKRIAASAGLQMHEQLAVVVSGLEGDSQNDLVERYHDAKRRARAVAVPVLSPSHILHCLTLMQRLVRRFLSRIRRRRAEAIYGDAHSQLFRPLAKPESRGSARSVHRPQPESTPAESIGTGTGMPARRARAQAKALYPSPYPAPSIPASVSASPPQPQPPNLQPPVPVPRCGRGPLRPRLSRRRLRASRASVVERVGRHAEHTAPHLRCACAASDACGLPSSRAARVRALSPPSLVWKSLAWKSLL